MTQNEQALKQALDAINQAKNVVANKRNEEDRKFIISGIGRDLVGILSPLLQEIAVNSKLNHDELTGILKEIKVDSPIVNVAPANIKVDAPNIPTIDFPKEELIKAIKEAIKGIKFPKTEVVAPIMPKEMKVAKIEELISGVKKLADIKMQVELSSKFNRENPLPVILTDEDGVFYKAITEVISAGGASGVGSLIGWLQENMSLAKIASIFPNQYKLAGNTHHLKKYYTAVGATVDGVIWSPSATTRWYITDIFIGVSADATVTLEDDLVAGDSVVWKHAIAANSGWSHSFQTPLYSGEDGADLIITNSAGNVYVTCSGYEI